MWPGILVRVPHMKNTGYDTPSCSRALAGPPRIRPAEKHHVRAMLLPPPQNVSMHHGHAGLKRRTYTAKLPHKDLKPQPETPLAEVHAVVNKLHSRRQAWVKVSGVGGRLREGSAHAWEGKEPVGGERGCLGGRHRRRRWPAGALPSRRGYESCSS